MYASVLVEIGVKNVDKLFTYIIPVTMQNKIKIGMRVKVNFGKMLLEGFVLEIKNTIENKHGYELKEIQALVDDEPILNEELLYLGKKIKETTLCSLISAYQIMLPKALKAKNKVNVTLPQERYIVLNKDIEEINDYLNNCKYPKQIKLLKELITSKKILVTKLNSTINTLIKKEIIKFTYQEKYRYKYELKSKYHNVSLNEKQQAVSNQVILNLEKSITYLLYGVTGSGKTEVYMNIIEKVIEKGQSALLLVPEISLTPQIIGRFVSKFGSNIAVFHSGLSDSEKYDEYRKIKQGQVNIVIGARSAIFAPLTNLGIIIIDEEHSSSYKQENNPRYHAKDIALLRSKYHNCPVILGSATPTIESYARALKGNYQLLKLDKRANDKKLPQVTIVDMKKEIRKNNSFLSTILIDKIKEKLTKKEQVILLLNRRGYSSLMTCQNCGFVFKCPNCDISLTYHKTSDNLRCHYCGYSSKKTTICPNCHSDGIKDYGLGTQKLEEELKKIFPLVRVVRMDFDTTSKKGAHQKIIDDFANYEYDILVGTQMIAKGLDFPKVTLVGVVNADISLNFPDFRSSEITFSLLSQVSGRAGRDKLEGEVVIQTFNNDHYAIALSKEHNYDAFFAKEMYIRKKLKYPPYYYLTLIKILSKDYQVAFEEASKIAKFLNQHQNDNLIVLGPSAANLFKINNIYHFQIIIKYKDSNQILTLLTNIDNIYKLNNKVNIEIDINPIKL